MSSWHAFTVCREKALPCLLLFFSSPYMVWNLDSFLMLIMQNEFSWTFRRCRRKSDWLDRTPSWIASVMYSKPRHTAFPEALHLSPFLCFSFLHISCHCPAQFWLHGESDGSPDLEGALVVGFKTDWPRSSQNLPRNLRTELVLHQVKPLLVSAAVLQLAPMRSCSLFTCVEYPVVPSLLLPLVQTGIRCKPGGP